MKNALRKEMKAKRALISDKSTKDILIEEHFVNSDLYKNCKLLLCYSSYGTEISTECLLR